jgi:hypothetical protein
MSKVSVSRKPSTSQFCGTRPFPMSVGFGFSAGDFISALELVATVFDTLRESGASSTEYRVLISQLHTFETALLRVKRLELDDSQHAGVLALRQAASQCQRSIDAFWEKIKKHQPSLRTGGSGSRVRDGWMKVKWVLCRREELLRFKADLMGHTESIEMLLTTVQMYVHLGFCSIVKWANIGKGLLLESTARGMTSIIEL